jgi:two-component system response regulator FixJ
VSSGSIHIVDDDEAVRESLQALLEAKGFTVSVHSSAEAFLVAYRPGPPACAVVDVRMPGMDGVALTERLAADGARLPVVIVTGHGDVPLAVRAMKAGATDFVEKPYSNDAILSAVAKALEMARSSSLGTDGAEAAERIAALTPRELEVLEKLVVGRPNKVIAFELKISPRTVEIHRANLMKKMEADSLSHLVRMAIAAGARPKTAPRSDT